MATYFQFGVLLTQAAEQECQVVTCFLGLHLYWLMHQAVTQRTVWVPLHVYNDCKIPTIVARVLQG